MEAWPSFRCAIARLLALSAAVFAVLVPPLSAAAEQNLNAAKPVASATPGPAAQASPQPTATMVQQFATLVVTAEGGQGKSVSYTLYKMASGSSYIAEKKDGDGKTERKEISEATARPVRSDVLDLVWKLKYHSSKKPLEGSACTLLGEMTVPATNDKVKICREEDAIARKFADLQEKFVQILK